MGSSRTPLLCAALAMLSLIAAPAAIAAGPIAKGLSPTSSRTLKPGVTLHRYAMTVNDHGRRRSINVWKVSWKAASVKLRLDSALLGTYYPDDRSIRLGRISNWAQWGAGNGLAAAINGDYFADSWAHGGSGKPSGLLVHDRRLLSFGWGGPAVGFAGADMVMGRPQAVPALITLPGARKATVGGYGTLPQRGDQLGVFGGSRVLIPTGGTGFVVESTAPLGLLRGSRTLVNKAGLGLSEQVAGFRFEDPSAAFRTVSMPLTAPPTCAGGICPAGSEVIVPEGAVVLVARSGSIAADGLSAKVAAGSRVVMSVDDQGWERIDDVMGGKPQLVANGSPITQRPSFVDAWQWSYSHWRPAAVKGANGSNWLIVAGAKGGTGIQGDTWARMLAQMGARQAMGFDNNSSTELYRPGAAPITAFDWERSIPSAIAVTYAP